jgi:hypothetical protein
VFLNLFGNGFYAANKRVHVGGWRRRIRRQKHGRAVGMVMPPRPPRASDRRNRLRDALRCGRGCAAARPSG